MTNRVISQGWKSINFWIIRKILNWTYTIWQKILWLYQIVREKKKMWVSNPHPLCPKMQFKYSFPPSRVIKCTFSDGNKVHQSSSSVLSEGCCWSVGGSPENWDRCRWGHLLEYKPSPLNSFRPTGSDACPKNRAHPICSLGPNICIVSLCFQWNVICHFKMRNCFVSLSIPEVTYCNQSQNPGNPENLEARINQNG